MDDDPFSIAQFVDVGVARLDGLGGARRVSRKREGVGADVVGRIAADMDRAAVDGALGIALKEMDEIVLDRGRVRSRLIGNGRQQHRIGGVIGRDLGRVVGRQRIVPAVEQRRDLGFADRRAGHRAPRLRGLRDRPHRAGGGDCDQLVHRVSPFLSSCPGSQPTLGRLRKLACPGIHADCRHALNFIMDCRVKPGNVKEKRWCAAQCYNSLAINSRMISFEPPKMRCTRASA